MSDISTTKKMMRAKYSRNRQISGDFDKRLAVTCHNGIFVGKKDGDVISYKGIPFAKPPVGERRWKAPEEMGLDGNVYQAFYFGPSPIQSEIASERASLYVQSEDCLYLNIWLNRLCNDEKKPVLVFIHGGSYGWGGTSDPLYEGTNLIRKFDDVILVTIAYRTGLMGFMDFSFVKGGEEFADSCNLGLLDQIAALKWIKRNIAEFGGDPDNITIAGESAGAGSVSLLPLIPQAKGLFNKVIAESGSVALTYSRDEVHDLTVKFMNDAGAKSMKDLMRLSEDKLKKLNAPLNEYNNFPLRDGRILPEDLYKAYEEGAGKDIPMLMGTNADEARYWISEVGGIAAYTVSIPIMFENNMKRVSAQDLEIINAFLDRQFGRPVWKYTQFYNEIMFRIPMLAQADAHANCGGDTYIYYWDYPSAIANMGACHAVELAYVFNNLTETIYTGDDVNVELADEIQNMWINFVRCGNPSTDKYTWPKYESGSRTSMVLASDIVPEKDLMGEDREALMPILKYNFNGCYANLDLRVPAFYKTILQVLAVIGGIAALIGGIFSIFKKDK